ncbi:hypothetical protein HDU96_000830, partial [Phlyctochytrium bullatum]
MFGKKKKKKDKGGKLAMPSSSAATPDSPRDRAPPSPMEPSSRPSTDSITDYWSDPSRFTHDTEELLQHHQHSPVASPSMKPHHLQHYSTFPVEAMHTTPPSFDRPKLSTSQTFGPDSWTSHDLGSQGVAGANSVNHGSSLGGQGGPVKAKNSSPRGTGGDAPTLAYEDVNKLDNKLKENVNIFANAVLSLQDRKKRLENAHKATKELDHAVKVFQESATKAKDKMWRKNCRLTIILFGILGVIALMFILAFVPKWGGGGSAPPPAAPAETQSPGKNSVASH